MFCTNCGRENKDGARFCTGCGAALGDSGTAPEPRRARPAVVAVVAVAVLLALAGVAFGVMLALGVGPFAPIPAAQQPAAVQQVAAPQTEDAGETPPQTEAQPAPEAEEPAEPEPQMTTVSHYQLVHQCMTWDEARRYCEENGGHLVTISSADELNEVLSLLPAEGLVSCWIGAYRTSAGDWAWVDGSELSYAAWGAGEPNNEDGTENYVTLLKVNDAWSMYDVPGDVSGFYANDKIGFVMETEEQVPVS